MKSGIASRSPRGRNPTIEALRALLVLEETGSVSEAARALGISQPVVSKKLRVFKDPQVCGAVLLRSEGSVELTEAAQAVLPAIRELIGRYDRILAFLHQDVVAPQALRIGSGRFAAEHYLPMAVAGLHESLEDCQIETQICRGRDRIIGTARGAFDLSIVTHDKAQIRQLLRDERLDESLLTVRRLSRQPMCLIALRHSEAGRELEAIGEDDVVPLHQLTSWELIGPDRQSGLRRQLEQRMKGKPLYFLLEGGGWAAAKEYARQGLGVAFAPRATLTESDRETLITRRLSPQFDVTHYLLHRVGERSELLKHAKCAIAGAARALDSGVP